MLFTNIIYTTLTISTTLFSNANYIPKTTLSWIGIGVTLPLTSNTMVKDYVRL